MGAGETIRRPALRLAATLTGSVAVSSASSAAQRLATPIDNSSRQPQDVDRGVPTSTAATPSPALGRRTGCAPAGGTERSACTGRTGACTASGVPARSQAR